MPILTFVIQTTVVIIGGGLAGLTAALHLAQAAVDVIVLEKKHYPHHKVCGEYVSNEVLPYLKDLGISFSQTYPRLKRFELHTRRGKCLKAQLPLGGFGISRFSFDHLLYQKAIENGARVLFEKVVSVHFKGDLFTVRTQQNTITSKYVLGCYGKRSSLDKSFQRGFINKKSPWVGIKAHFNASDFPKDLVALGTFNGGYAGLSMVENNRVNFCYLVNYRAFQCFGNIDAFNKAIVFQNPFLRKIINALELSPDFEKPLGIAQISFEKKSVTENHIMMCGDSAGLIHPLCGNGMAMAIMAAKLAAETLIQGLESKLERSTVERHYEKSWNQEFLKRLWFGRQLQYLFMRPALLENLLELVPNNSALLRFIISMTHGKLNEVT